MAFNFLQLLWENIFEPKQKQQKSPIVKREKKNKKYKSSPPARVGQKRNRSLILSKSSKHKIPKTPIKKKAKNNTPEKLETKNINTFTFQISPKNKFLLNQANYYSPHSILNTTQFPPNSPFQTNPAANFNTPGKLTPLTPHSQPTPTPKASSTSKRRKNKHKKKKSKTVVSNTQKMDEDFIEISDDESDIVEQPQKAVQTDYEYEVALAVGKIHPRKRNNCRLLMDIGTNPQKSPDWKLWRNLKKQKSKMKCQGRRKSSSKSFPR